ncbi:MAG: DNA starvation/stationary phase protection protein [Gammaproteobacteria bacterium CG11_big_fil_rev_8_21_14_0_20_46_22]|nr:MAG: DNA starvation/stationary phase protection protein [Gammaproteobacteria bacterium CG11_big_fil_rev_8_21_14_0_20_46_22]
MSSVTSALTKVFANTYALYLKAQNFHWHVKGIQFKELHELFEVQYTELAQAVDDLAERIRTLGANVPASFSALNDVKTLDDGDSNMKGEDMLKAFVADHRALIDDLYAAMKVAQEAGDEGSIALISERIAHHEKSAWMLDATLA